MTSAPAGTRSLRRADGINEHDSPSQRRYAKDAARSRETEAGYSAIQSTKPDSLMTALNDSPAGLVNWLVEKYCRRSDHDCAGDVEQRFSKHQLLTMVMTYWATGTIGSSDAERFSTVTRTPQYSPRIYSNSDTLRATGPSAWSPAGLREKEQIMGRAEIRTSIFEDSEALGGSWQWRACLG